MAMKWLGLGMAAVMLTACSSVVEKVEPKMAPIESELSLERLWQVKHERFRDMDSEGVQFAQTENLIYTVSSTGMISALKKSETGRWTDQIVWQAKLAENITAGATLSGTQLLVGTSKGRLKAFDAQTGTFLWSKQLSSEVSSLPVVVNGMVYVRTVDGNLFALNAVDQSIVWQSSQPMPKLSLRGSPAVLVEDGVVYVPWETGLVQALKADSGVLLWETRIAIPTGRTDLERMVDIQSSLQSANGYLYVAGFHGKFAALDKQTGNFIFVKELSSYRDFVVDGASVFFVDEEDILYGFDALSGSPLWKQTSMKGREVGDLTVNQKALLVTDAWGYVHWFNKVQGTEFARYKYSDGYGTGNSAVRVFADNQFMFLYDDDGVLTLYRDKASNLIKFRQELSGGKPEVMVQQPAVKKSDSDAPWYQFMMNLWPF